jgi:putative glutamine amidotransferase
MRTGKGHSARSKPLIGLPGRRKLAKQVDGFPDNLSDLAVDLYLADYSRSVLAAGGLPVLVPMDGDPDEYVPHLQGIVLTGGADMDPAAYGQAADGNGGYEPERDRLELALLEGAIDRDLAVLGICRGLQVINVQAGGTLHQHVPEHARYDVAPEARVHRVNFEPESRLGLLYTGRPSGSAGVSVNSLHHQTVDRLGRDLKITARDDDGVVEGIEVPGQDIVAVQWHPEMLREPEPVFAWLVAQAEKRVVG